VPVHLYNLTTLPALAFPFSINPTTVAGAPSTPGVSSTIR